MLSAAAGGRAAVRCWVLALRGLRLLAMSGGSLVVTRGGLLVNAGGSPVTARWLFVTAGAPLFTRRSLAPT